MPLPPVVHTIRLHMPYCCLCNRVSHSARYSLVDQATMNDHFDSGATVCRQSTCHIACRWCTLVSGPPSLASLFFLKPNILANQFDDEYLARVPPVFRQSRPVLAGSHAHEYRLSQFRSDHGLLWPNVHQPSSTRSTVIDVFFESVFHQRLLYV